MADVLLHDYVEQLRGHVQAGRLSDGLALGQHILRYYPKHLETYVILAQASLDNDDLAGATDLFRRVLSADPENVLALAGMALVSEAQDNDDEALWYLERAYEIQPTNDELRRELVRLREAYYGAQPERLELTPGALARVYARQGQYAYAVNEFRRLLRTESKRYDARVALAEMLYRAGRTDEAAQLAQTIMTDAPFALKPNLILGALWSENAVAEGEQFLRRAQQVDPEARVARELLGARFSPAPPPRLPSLDEPLTPSQFDGQIIGLAHGEPGAFDSAQAGASAFWQELESASAQAQPEPAPETLGFDSFFAAEPPPSAPVAPPVLETPRAPVAPETATPVAPETAVAVAPETAAPAVADAQPSSATPFDATLAEIIAAEQAHAAAAAPPPSPPPPTAAPAPPHTPRTRSKADAIPTDAIAAAAAALATSIAVDKLKQPAPARRTHPALPKVRPVIGEAGERLPGWLRVSATPAQAAASFDAAPPSQTERIEPLAPPASQAATPPTQAQPDWLAPTQVTAPETIARATETEIPDWLRPAASELVASARIETPAAESFAPPAPDVTETVLPTWLRAPTAAETPAAPIAQTPAAPLPDWLGEPTAKTDAAAVPAAPFAAPEIVAAPPEAELPEPGAPPQAPAAALPGWLTEASSPPPPAPDAPAQPLASAQPLAAQALAPEPPAEKPLDARTLIENARTRRSNGDIKGALDMYERAMHRRPNHLDEIITDLQSIAALPNTPATTHRLLGEAFAMAGRFKESLEQYRRAMAK